jgi:Lar family restriction alleviation protein
MSGELLPCPFCGGEARLITGQHNFVDAQVSCLDCHASGPDFDHDPAIGAFCDDTETAATAHWNTRSITVALPEAQKTL